MQKREFTDLEGLRLVYQGNKIVGNLFSKSVHSVIQLTLIEAKEWVMEAQIKYAGGC